MKRLVHRLHIWLGLIVALPVLAWSLSGFIYSLPSSVEGSKYAAINSDEIRIGPKQAIESARRFAGDELPVSALTLQNRNGRIEYQAVSGVRSILIDAATGEVFDSPPPSWSTSFFREAHFYFFAYPYNALLTGLFSGLACLSVITGIYLNAAYWLREEG